MSSTTTTSVGFNQETFEAFLQSRTEPSWLTEQRRAAWELFQKLPMPSRSDEEWMRTDIRAFRLDQFGLPGDPNSSDSLSTIPAPLLSHNVQLGGKIVTLDAHLTEAKLDSKLAEQGVIFGCLEAALQAHGDILRPYLFQAVKQDHDKFAALHAACFTGGTVLYVPRGVVVDQPLHALSAMSASGVDFNHTLVILEEGAEATLLSETSGGATSGFHCGAIELIVGRNATLRYVNLQNWGRGVWHFAHQKGLVAGQGKLQWTIGALGSRLAKVNQHVALTEPHASAEVNGVMFTEGKQHLAYQTLQHHQGANCKSDLLYKGALQDNSRVVWRGMIKVDPDAQKTDGYQRNDNLILSQEARADSIPGLEIEADDVRCTHGSTTGRVDDEQVFYARCRGLTNKEAVRMVVAGFFQKVFDRITIESVREALAEAIGKRVREYE